MIYLDFSIVANLPVHRMGEIVKVKVEFPVCHIVAREFSARWHQLIFNFVIHNAQLYKEDCTILQIC